ncbi:hypothetical protein BARBAKC583_0215 [Bartonella bacilliformis KC583]|uniref:Uncharacterized protein n=1 Tax=Bartonella bacilliformis (strain ATCC 35685 / KC583 / Herrer 020/F12,63) TaxID=360095 RepID=A1URE8_BARBK|nr:hypothetical protein BARBAKC583_0215 [Bartonella bacilliformis KC583]
MGKWLKGGLAKSLAKRDKKGKRSFIKGSLKGSDGGKG